MAAREGRVSQGRPILKALSRRNLWVTLLSSSLEKQLSLSASPQQNLPTSPQKNLPTRSEKNLPTSSEKNLPTSPETSLQTSSPNCLSTSPQKSLSTGPENSVSTRLEDSLSTRQEQKLNHATSPEESLPPASSSEASSSSSPSQRRHISGGVRIVLKDTGAACDRAQAKASLDSSKLGVLRCKLALADERLCLPDSRLTSPGVREWLQHVERRLAVAQRWISRGGARGTLDPLPPSPELLPGGAGGRVGVQRYAEEWLVFAEDSLRRSQHFLPPDLLGPAFRPYGEDPCEVQALDTPSSSEWGVSWGAGSGLHLLHLSGACPGVQALGYTFFI